MARVGEGEGVSTTDRLREAVADAVYEILQEASGRYGAELPEHIDATNIANDTAEEFAQLLRKAAG